VARTGAAHGGGAGRQRDVLGMGHSNRRLGGAALQPDVVSQRLGVAARQRPHRGGPVTLPVRRPGGGAVRRPVRRGAHDGRAAPAGAVLRPPSPPPPPPPPPSPAPPPPPPP